MAAPRGRQNVLLAGHQELTKADQEWNSFKLFRNEQEGRKLTIVSIKQVLHVLRGCNISNTVAIYPVAIFSNPL